MVKVEGGTFIMGSTEIGEDDCPPHEVSLSDFYIGVCEVSQGLWKEIMGYNPSDYQPTALPDGKPYTQEQRDSFPVENVSFEDVQEFIRRLNQRTGQHFSLPTEAQWEFAARGGNKSKGSKFATGSPSPESIWYKQNNTRRVGASKVANELGLYHMSGNVAEWCEDYYDEDYYKESGGMTNPINRNIGIIPYHIIRGGSFSDDDPNNVSVYFRSYINQGVEYVGFRLVIN